MAVLGVVPAEKRTAEGPGILQRAEALWKLRTVLKRLELRLRERIVVAASMGLDRFYEGVVINLCDLTYEFGDSLMSVIELPYQIKGGDFPYCIAVSENCRTGIVSLLEFAKVQEKYRLVDGGDAAVDAVFEQIVSV